MWDRVTLVATNAKTMQRGEKTSKLTLIVSDSICSYFSDVFANPRALLNQLIERLTQSWPSKFHEQT